MYKRVSFLPKSFSFTSTTETATLYSHSLCTSSQTKTMDKLMEIADQATSDVASSSSTSSMAISLEKFSGFMKQNPIWNFCEITKSDYIVMPETEKLKLIEGYYKHMNDGKIAFNYPSSLIRLSMLTYNLF